MDHSIFPDRRRSGERRLKTVASLAALTLAIALATVFLLPTAGAAADGLPHITSLSTDHGVPGSSLTITGYGFGATQGSSYVRFKSQVLDGAITGWTDTQIIVTVPPNLVEYQGLTQMWVWVDPTGPSPQMTNELDFTIEGPTWIDTIAPAHGAPGTVVTLKGHGFTPPSPGSAWVNFYGDPVHPAPTSLSDTQLTFAVPDVTTGRHSVNMGSEWGISLDGHTSGVVTFNVDPKITSLAPARARPTAVVTITGTGFGQARGTSTVRFGAKAATAYVSWSDTQVKVKVPKLAAGRTSVKVKTPQGTTAGRVFTVL